LVPSVAWQKICAALEDDPELPLAPIDAALARWDAFPQLREPTEAQWRRIHWDGWRPPWWPLVRHVSLGSDESLDGIPAAHLRSLWIKASAGWDPDILQAVPQLVHLDLTGHELDCRTIPSLPSLEELILTRGVPIHPEALAKLSTLASLSLGWTDLGPRDVPYLPKLAQLDLSGADIDTLAPLTALPSLRMLRLGQCTGSADTSVLLQCLALRSVYVAEATLDTRALEGQTLFEVVR
jgi:hypothetical protein